MNHAELTLDWCRVCCTQHGDIRPCPGLLEPREKEVPGRRFAARRPMGTEVYQVLVAPERKEGRWQARIVTAPDRPWTIPGRPTSAKFLADSMDEAERRAVLYVFKICREKKIEVVEIDSGPERVRDDLETGRRIGGKRFEQRLTALFGVERPDSPALVLNLSPTGLCLWTERPEAVGTRIHVAMQIGQFRIPLTGVVIWSRRRVTRDLPVGMGVELEDSPFPFRQFYQSLQAAETDPDEG